MLEEKTSAAAVGPEAAPKTPGARRAVPRPASRTKQQRRRPCSRQFTLQYLIAALKKPSK